MELMTQVKEYYEYFLNKGKTLDIENKKIKKIWEEGYTKFGIAIKSTEIYEDALKVYWEKYNEIYDDIFDAIKTVKSERYKISKLFGFLLVDFWFFRSGYTKNYIVGAIKKLTLTEEEKLILEEIILKNIEFAGIEFSNI